MSRVGNVSEGVQVTAISFVITGDRLCQNDLKTRFFVQHDHCSRRTVLDYKLGTKQFLCIIFHACGLLCPTFWSEAVTEELLFC
jgi:hypothetical protein